MIDDDVMVARGRDLMEAELGDEIVALDPASSQCYAFNPTAATLWRAIGAPQRFGALVEAMGARFVVERDTCAADLTALIEDLARDGVVRIEPAAR